MIDPDLRIAKPCHEDWGRMNPAERGRHCAVCDKTVVDVTALPAGEQRRALAEIDRRVRGGDKVCVRAHADTRGRLLSPRLRRHLLTNSLAAIIAMSFAGCTGGGSNAQPQPVPQHATEKPQPQPQPMMGAPAPVAQPVTIKGEAVAQPAPQPQVLTGDVAVAPAPAPQHVIMGKIAAPPPVPAQQPYR